MGADDHTIYTYLMPALLQVFFATDKLIVSFLGGCTHLHHIDLNLKCYLPLPTLPLL